MTPSQTSPLTSRRAGASAVQRPWLVAALVFGAAVGLWFAWLGWDTDYDVDPATGHLSGPYSWWQVAGFVVSATVLVLAAGRFLRPLPVGTAAALGITGGFALSARADDSGLAVIGISLTLLGSAAGAALLLLLSRLLAGWRGRWRRRRPAAESAPNGGRGTPRS